MSLAAALAFPITLFFVGLVGVVLRRNLIVILMSMELMLNAAGLALVVFHAVDPSPAPVSLVLLLLGLAAAEVAIGLALAINLVRFEGSPDVDLARMLRG